MELDRLPPEYGNNNHSHFSEGSPASVQFKYEQLRTVCLRLWPAVRFFGLCGAAPQYLDAAIAMGRLIGTIPAGDAALCDPETVRQVGKREGLALALAHLKEADSVRKRTGRSGQAELVQDLEQEFKELGR
jgi:hypothetical protein